MADHTVAAFIASGTDLLITAGCDTPRLDAEALVAAVMGVDIGIVIREPEVPVPDEMAARISFALDRRANREPMEYILGQCYYHGLILAVDSRVHIPRADKAALVIQPALALPVGATLHDVGTGCGAVALAIKSERLDLCVSGSDISEEAIEVATMNATRLQLDVDVYVADGLPSREFDLVVAVLPYGPLDLIDTCLPPEVHRHQPRIALAAGTDGLEHIRRLILSAPTGQLLALEHDPRQADPVRALLDDPHTELDLHGDERVTIGRAK